MLARQRVANVVRDEKEQLGVNESSLVVDPYEAILAADLSVHIGNAVKSLPVALREAFVLRYYDGLSYDTIATMISESAGTVRMRVHRAKALLRQQLVHVRSDVR
jgi:RNA polymerase sigma-70 factor (ECF subfamily)